MTQRTEYFFVGGALPLQLDGHLVDLPLARRGEFGGRRRTAHQALKVADRTF
jgi:hypothetical protein